MADYDWSGVADRADRARRSWPQTIAALPVGLDISGRVLARMRFGVFVEIEGQPDAVGLLEVTQLPAGRELPAVGEVIDGVVSDHVTHNHQVRLRPRPTE
ncbi:hypothetical protein [Micromonospora sp. RTP1Z1]|uniref:hypothetical protein n=1 Tax=Micromonospora sp. RTP1Z1 TaxID=2994043 RepID=UPI0029C6DC28|nr:hypothetical protein [Micromonospora sp. RTP1Z1]